MVMCMRVNQAKQAVKCKLWHTILMLHWGAKLVIELQEVLCEQV